MTQTSPPEPSALRAATLFVALGVVGAMLIGRVAYLQTYGREQTIRKAERQQHMSMTLQARRGCIFDRNGMLMAGTIETRTLFLDCKFMQDAYQEDGKSLVQMDDDLRKLADILDKDAFELSQLVSDKFESRYIKLAEHLDDSACSEIEKLDLPGVGFIPDHVRYYPMGSLGAHVLGGMGKDGGLEGLELKYEKTLAGKNGYVRELKDARRRPISVAAEDYLPPEHGQHVVLTLDANIQMIAEQELATTCESYRAQRGEAIILDPQTGEILALANWPTFNPQNLEDSLPTVRRNSALVMPYEPGSTLKPFIVGPALAAGTTRWGEVFPIHGPRWTTYYNRKVTDVHGYDQLALWDVLVKSSNIGMSMLAERMGNTALHGALRSFGFGKPSGIELPGEDPGRLSPLKIWTKYSTESIAQGYEMMVTPLQLARAFSVYANGGRLVNPHLLKGSLNVDGSVDALPNSKQSSMLPQVIDAGAAAQVRRILCDVPVRGTATKARSNTWNIFGKTGTAHVSAGKAGYEEKYTSSFLAGAPYENPRVVIAFIIHEPDKAHCLANGLSYYGGAVAAPGASRVLERTLAYLQVPASPDLPLPPPDVAAVLYNFNAKQYERKVATASVRE